MRMLRAMMLALAAGFATWAWIPAQAAEPIPTAAIRAHSYDVLIRRMQHYFDPAVAAKVAAALAADRARILAARDNAAFIAAVNATLFGASHDRHLQIYLHDGAPPAADAPHGAHGIERVERRDGGIGYLELTGFSNASDSVGAIDAAMARLSGSRALILDLRRNGGGGQVSFLRLLGHLFPARTELNGISWRTCVNPPGSAPDGCVQGAPRIERQFTDQPPRPAFPTAPVYVLVSHTTFSAAEAAAYELQQHRRATILGETTGGGGNPSAGMDLESAFVVIMPIGRLHKVTPGDGWEGVGVSPDVATPAADAERRAIALISGDEGAVPRR